MNFLRLFPPPRYIYRSVKRAMKSEEEFWHTRFSRSFIWNRTITDLTGLENNGKRIEEGVEKQQPLIAAFYRTRIIRVYWRKQFLRGVKAAPITVWQLANSRYSIHGSPLSRKSFSNKIQYHTEWCADSRCKRLQPATFPLPFFLPFFLSFFLHTFLQRVGTYKV